MMIDLHGGGSMDDLDGGFRFAMSRDRVDRKYLKFVTDRQTLSRLLCY
jgi:hypothetical protein